MITFLLKRCFGSSKVTLPRIDITRYINQQKGWEEDCQAVANSLHQYGLLIIRDPRVNAEQNNKFLHLMEQYFVKRSAQFDAGQTNLDFSPQSNFQVGIMHENQQKFKDFAEIKMQLKEPNKSLTPLKPDRDPKWRYHWKVDYPNNVIPKDFPSFEETMNGWGTHMKNGCFTVTEMAALALGLEKNALRKTIDKGAFMLSPTASDLQKNKVGTVLAGFHYDFDLLTIHGKARFPGLFAWLNNGHKFSVEVPEGHLLLQAGKQLQWYTGGYIKAGFHQVIYTEEVDRLKNLALEEGRVPWRISSTMFCQVEESQIMQPLDKFKNQESLKKYPLKTADEYLQEELYILTQLK